MSQQETFYELMNAHYRLHAVFQNGDVHPHGNPIPEEWFEDFVQLHFDRLSKPMYQDAGIVDWVIARHELWHPISYCIDCGRTLTYLESLVGNCCADCEISLDIGNLHSEEEAQTLALYAALF